MMEEGKGKGGDDRRGRGGEGGDKEVEVDEKSGEGWRRRGKGGEKR